jgi:hypothetical protein
VSRFTAGAGHGEKKQQVLSRLLVFFERFFGLGESEAVSEGSAFNVPTSRQAPDDFGAVDEHHDP